MKRPGPDAEVYSNLALAREEDYAQAKKFYDGDDDDEWKALRFVRLDTTYIISFFSLLIVFVLRRLQREERRRSRTKSRARVAKINDSIGQSYEADEDITKVMEDIDALQLKREKKKKKRGGAATTRKSRPRTRADHLPKGEDQRNEEKEVQ